MLSIKQSWRIENVLGLQCLNGGEKRNYRLTCTHWYSRCMMLLPATSLSMWPSRPSASPESRSRATIMKSLSGMSICSGLWECAMPWDRKKIINCQRLYTFNDVRARVRRDTLHNLRTRCKYWKGNVCLWHLLLTLLIMDILSKTEKDRKYEILIAVLWNILKEGHTKWGR